MRLFERSNFISKVVIPFGLIIVLLSYFAPFWPHLNEQSNDYWRTYIAKEGQPESSILIIEIDDQSLTAMEPLVGRWPWPRSMHAFLLEGLNEANAEAIVFDILFSEVDVFRPDDDAFFTETARNKEHIFFPAVLVSDNIPITETQRNQLPESLVASGSSDEGIKLILPNLILPGTNPIGLINFTADIDGVAREYPVKTITGAMTLNSLPFVVAKSVSNQLTDTHSIGLKYQGIDSVPYQSIAYSDAWQLIQAGDLAIFSNKIIIIGATATGLHDLVESPFAKSFPATTVLATAIDNLMNNDFLSSVSPLQGLVLLAVMLALIYSLVISQFNYRQTLFIMLFALVLLGVLLYSYSYWLIHNNLLFPNTSVFTLTVIAICFTLITQGVQEYLSRQHATNTFSRFMDPKVVNTLIDNEDWQTLLDYKSQEVTILFSDIRGFTTLSESRTPEQVMQLLNQYFNKQVDAIFKEQGTLDKFIGDAIMAFWGAPIVMHDHADRAIRCALAMVDGLTEFKQQLPADLQDFDIGIGIHTGPAVVGMLGSDKRFDYTAIGDAVNLSSRIEGVTKGRARILVSEETKNSCSDAFNFSLSGEFNVKGRQQPVRLYSLT